MKQKMRSGVVILIITLWACLTFGSTPEIGSYSRMEFQPPAADNGELLIDFDNADSQSSIAAFLARAGLKTGQYSWFSTEEQWVRVRNVTSVLRELLRGASDVEGVEPNYYMSAFAVPNDPYYKYQWHLDQIGMRRAWDYPTGGPVTVAVIDTGIAYEKHNDSFRVEDLGETQFVKPYNFVEGTDHANDDHGHGTHVAGTIAQLTNNGVGVAGIAPAVKLMPLKVLNASGYGTISDIAAAIRYAADNGAQVINMSLGGPFPSRILHKAVQYAHNKGVVIVCAAGNGGGSGLSYPAAYPECISVSAVRYDGQLAWYSSYGEGLTIAAPGGDMRVDQNGDGLMDGVLQNTLNPQDKTSQGYFLFQGTSMAAPHVAAVAALLVSQGVTDPEKVRGYLTESATKVKDGTTEKYGAGIVNAAEALESAFLGRKIRLGAFA
ncbi:MAG TPA: S8 family peptidase, partial [Acidobacteriota bacterium]|nr:S8 family peptidase [Acidobacteriota bacterium]